VNSLEIATNAYYVIEEDKYAYVVDSIALRFADTIVAGPYKTFAEAVTIANEANISIKKNKAKGKQ
jgi:hypothetical protein